jgi:hypothetical protein
VRELPPPQLIQPADNVDEGLGADCARKIRQ